MATPTTEDVDPAQNRSSFVLMDPPEPTGRRRAVAVMTNRAALRGFEDLIRGRTGELEKIKAGRSLTPTMVQEILLVSTPSRIVGTHG